MHDESATQNKDPGPEESHDRHSEVLRIATAPARFAAGLRDPGLEADIAFTGSRWGQPRAIETNLLPDTVPSTVAIWGHGWSDSPTLASYARGFVEYARMPDIYASTEIVIDDTIEQARPWASVNSRVFDALGAGTLVVTNGELGAKGFDDDRLRIAIKVPATNHEVKEAWGDYHFALALRRCFWMRGHAVRIDVLCDWDTPQTIDDDLVLVLGAA